MAWTRFRRRGATLAALVAALLVVVPLAASVQAAPAARAQSPQVLRVALVQEIDHLNPFTASFASSAMIGRFAWEFLTLPSAEDATPTGGVAESWESSEDKLTWTFTIREGMTWSDGEPVTAHDAAFTFNKIMSDPKAAEANGSYVVNFKKVSAPDDRTLVIETEEPQASMTALDVPIVPEHVWSKIEDMHDPVTDSIEVVGVGSGPFLIAEYRPNELVRMTANKDYWRGAPAYDELHFIKFENADAAVNALRNGEVDFVNRLTRAQFDSLKNEPNIETNQASGRRYRELLMNPGARNADGDAIGDGHPALQDVQVRRAIAMAIDPEVLVDKVLGGYGELPGGLVPPIYEDYHYVPDEDVRYSFDPDAANALLDEAGYRRGPDGVRVDSEGRRLEFRLTGRASEDYAQRASDYIVSWLRDIGIEVTKNLVSDNEVDETTSSGHYDLAFSGWGTNPDPDYILNKQTCAALPAASGSSSSNAFFCDETYDKLYAQQIAEMDPKKRAKLVLQAQARYYEMVPSLVLGYDNVLEAYRSDRFTGFVQQPEGEGQIMEQTGYWGFYGARPVEGAAESDSGLPTGVWLALGAGALALLAVGGTVVVRRRATADDRE
ncbi:peptide/nickel transport system substrate-binding protein [Saccharomonospora viridis]|uniref:Peptide ABC transporter substrate-binding protein n=1 Tax=Saccharomonospora viridis TaxID=1852 RepID=A0A837DBQ5_9PSEU|nr:peptide ABC transporter substrate-binding protein [Saccharomonospora viridis]SFO82269.1 peptide/nickel transport system substrate-binding protein [Saccharomonospora viridis]